jgi:hypothetical protein
MQGVDVFGCGFCPGPQNGMAIQATVSGAGTWDENLDGQHHTTWYSVHRNSQAGLQTWKT